MYKCTVCNAEYQKKPDYCECGNDTFYEIQAEQSSSIKNIESLKQTLPVKKMLSILIFILCIMFSIVIIQFKPSDNAGKKTSPQNTVTEIPDIEQFWNSTPPEETKNTSDVITVYEKVIQKKEPVKSKQTDYSALQNNNKDTAAKNIKRTNSTAKPQQIKKPNETQTQVSKNQKTPPQQKPPETVTTPNIVTEPSKITQNPPPKTVQPDPQPVKTMNSQEWTNYKNSLRYALLSKLDLVKIYGEGDCAIEFSLDQNGKLLNRKFIYKSQNKSVNDQIYLMLMKLPVYKTPPAGYNGEKVKLKFYINNGTYEISFI